ncbi:MAG: LysR substrate-binding domain-containing protein [Polyangiales bacterium]
MELLTSRLNLHHLHYFWIVAHDGQLTRAATRLRLSQSALSTQIRQLEAQLGVALFDRVGRTLQLTEAGRVTLVYADDLFRVGSELVTTLQRGRSPDAPLRVGAQSTLSRNFQEAFLRPLIHEPGVRLRLEAGRLDALLARLSTHELDVVLSTEPPRRQEGSRLRSRRVARQAVSVVGRPRAGRFRFPEDVVGVPMILPPPDSGVRAGFDALCERAQCAVTVFAEVDDMAALRLLARDTGALTLVPSVVVQDELRSGVLQELWVVPELFESFYAVTAERHYPHPLVARLLRRDSVLSEGRSGAAEGGGEAPKPPRSRRGKA